MSTAPAKEIPTAPSAPASASAAEQKSWAQVQGIAAVFCVLVSACLLYQHVRAGERDPWKSPQLLALKEELRGTPTQEEVKREIRRLDLEFRQRYTHRLTASRTGGWLLVGGVAVMLMAAKRRAALRARPWLPSGGPAGSEEMRAAGFRARRSVVGLGLLTGVSLLTLALMARSPLPKSEAELAKLLRPQGEASPDAVAPSVADFLAQWPRFRGPEGSGVRSNDAASDPAGLLAVQWQTPIPARGFGSPVIWSNQLFLSGGDAVKREVFCFRVSDGQLLWRQAVTGVPGSPVKPPEIPEETGYAAPTMATDGRLAFALFANGDLAALRLDGTPAWAKNLGPLKNMYGHATSLALWPGRLIVQLDQDEGAPGGSKLLALDPGSGRVLWERSKPTHGSWATPVIFEAAGKLQIVTLALPFIQSHALADGQEVWRAELMEGEITPSPIFAGGLVVTVNPGGKINALRPHGQGDVTKTHVAWTSEENIPDVTSPVSSGELVFTVTSLGNLAALDLKTGALVWKHDLDMEVQASPTLAGSRLLVLGKHGELVTVAAGREFQELGRVKLPDVFHASPALAPGNLFLRGATNLWCLRPLTENAHAR